MTSGGGARNERHVTGCFVGGGHSPLDFLSAGLTSDAAENLASTLFPRHHAHNTTNNSGAVSRRVVSACRRCRPCSCPRTRRLFGSSPPASAREQYDDEGGEEGAPSPRLWHAAERPDNAGRTLGRGRILCLPGAAARPRRVAAELLLAEEGEGVVARDQGFQRECGGDGELGQTLQKRAAVQLAGLGQANVSLSCTRFRRL